MKLITTRDRIRGVAAEWKRQYQRDLKTNEKWAGVYKSLCALDKETATPADVEQIIGNDSWTELTCEECDQHPDAIIRFGEERDYDSRSLDVCRDCIRGATAILKAKP